MENQKGVYEKIMNEMNAHKFSVFQLKWERKSKNSMQLRCQVVIPAQYSREEIIAIFMEIPEMETFEMI